MGGSSSLLWLRLLPLVRLGLGKDLLRRALLRGLFLLDKDLLLLVLLRGLVPWTRTCPILALHLGRVRLDRDLLLQALRRGLLPQMLFQFLEIIMLQGPVRLQELQRLEVDLQSLQLCLPTNLPRTGSPPWAG